MTGESPEFAQNLYGRKTSMSRSLKQQKRGLTALEIVIVLMILSVFSTFAILSYSTYRKQARIKEGAKTIQYALTTARTLAINQNANYQVQVDIPNGQFWIDKLDSKGNIARPKVTGINWLPDDVAFVEVRKNTLSYDTGTVPILFRPNGSSEYASIYLIGANVDAADGGNYFTIRVYSSTGVIQTFKNQRR